MTCVAARHILFQCKSNWQQPSSWPRLCLEEKSWESVGCMHHSRLNTALCAEVSM